MAQHSHCCVAGGGRLLSACTMQQQAEGQGCINQQLPSQSGCMQLQLLDCAVCIAAGICAAVPDLLAWLYGPPASAAAATSCVPGVGGGCPVGQGCCGAGPLRRTATASLRSPHAASCWHVCAVSPCVYSNASSILSGCVWRLPLAAAAPGAAEFAAAVAVVGYFMG
jgi:hypothetical protein